jgi:daunorubicin resistance ABC transporter ATP-binding subunit
MSEKRSAGESAAPGRQQCRETWVRPESAGFFLESANMPGKRSAGEPGKESRGKTAGGTTVSDTPAIEAEGLIKSYGKTLALSGLDLSVAPGTVYGLLGPNGAGKTTAVRILATLLRPDSGHARVMGHDVVGQAAAARRVIGLTGQYAALDEYLSGRSNLIMIGQLSRLTARAARRRSDELLDRFGLTEAAARAVKTYSGGMRRRLDLAASLIAHPSVLFLDEPTTGLDPSARALMWDIVRQLVADGTTLLLTTQYLDEADQLAERVAVIDGGKVIAEGTPAELKASVGGQRMVLNLADPADAPMAAKTLAPFATCDISPDGPATTLEVPVITADGLATQVLRALDAAGVLVNEIAVRTASLDDVFLTLTGQAVSRGEEDAA